MRALVFHWLRAFNMDFRPRDENVKLFASLVREELDELLEAYENRFRTGTEAVVKEAADLRWVVYGLCQVAEADDPEVEPKLFLSNMSKIGTKEEIEGWIAQQGVQAKAVRAGIGEGYYIAVREPDGKILKGPNYKTVDEV